jgi:muramoyltetrapeptide carboxypeptidase LdcA involved in peptidoglycan recycling
MIHTLQRYDFPIVTDMDFGHTAPQCTLPNGCRASIDTVERIFEVTEAAVVSPGGQ